MKLAKRYTNRNISPFFFLRYWISEFKTPHRPEILTRAKAREDANTTKDSIFVRSPIQVILTMSVKDNEIKGVELNVENVDMKEEFLSSDFNHCDCEFCVTLKIIDQKLKNISNSYEGHKKEKWINTVIDHLRFSMRKEYESTQKHY